MLVLSRKVSETIQIGPDVVITIVKVKGGVARIGIDAPSGVRVARGELAESIKENGAKRPDLEPMKVTGV